jgi:uncharacterized membrane protein
MKSKKNYYFWYYNNHKTTKTMENNNANQAPATNNMAVGILSYLGIILWIIAYIIHGNGKTAYGAFHLRQGLGLAIAAIALYIVYFILLMVVPFLGLIFGLVFIAILVFMIIGIINAAKFENKPLPVVGGMFEKWFAGIK